mgnify:FL=1
MNKIINGNITIYMQDLRLKRDIGYPYVIKPGTTLNDILDINKDGYTTTIYPTIQYFCIGVGGKRLVNNTNYTISQHSAKDVQPFDMIPFVLRRAEDDLGTKLRKEYSFRKEIVVDGVNYIGYYLKRIPKIISRDEFFKISIDENKRNSLSILNTNDMDIIYPKPIDKEDLINHKEKATLIVKTNKFLFSLTKEELLELENVMNILGKGSSLTEIALCTSINGIDTLAEPSKVQCAYFTTTDIDINLRISEKYPVKLFLEVGSNEPYL